MAQTPTIRRIATGIALPAAAAALPTSTEAAEAKIGPVLGLNQVINTGVPRLLQSDEGGYFFYALFSSSQRLSWAAGVGIDVDKGQAGNATKHLVADLTYRRFGSRTVAGGGSIVIHDDRLVAAALFQRRYRLVGFDAQPTVAVGPQIGFRLTPKVKAKATYTYDGSTSSYSNTFDLSEYEGPRKWWLPDVGVTAAVGAVVPMGGQDVDLSLRFTQGLLPQATVGGENMIRQIGLFGGVTF